jgi:hypothetical protein
MEKSYTLKKRRQQKYADNAMTDSISGMEASAANRHASPQEMKE